MTPNLVAKSRWVSLVLTVLFGPLGLFYSSALAALVLCVIVFMTASTVIVPIVCWVLAIAIGDHCTYRHNQNIKAFEGLMARRTESEE